MDAAPVPKPYVYVKELAALTPWTKEAIEAKVKRGELRRGVHYFQEHHRGRLIFKWVAIVELIEGGNDTPAPEPHAAGVNGKVLDVAKATTELSKLLD